MRRPKIPLNLFKPGDGTPPPEFAGRAQDERALRSYASGMDARDAAGKANIAANCLLYGPRGNGKTALLERLRTWAEKRPKWHVLNMNVSEDAGDLRSAAQFIASRPWFQRIWRRLSQTQVDLSSGLAGAHLGFGVRLPEIEASPWRIDQALAAAASSGPCLLLVDEAHRLPSDLCAALLDASRMLRTNGAPLLLVLSGTPALRDTLSASNVSNWDRGKHLPLGPLPQGAARQALTKPLQRHGVSCTDPTALRKAEDAMQDYAFFTQLFGEAAVEALNHRDARDFDGEAAQAAIDLFKHKRHAFYDNRREEVRALGCVTAAAAAWGAMRGHGGKASADMLVQIMERFAPPDATGEDAFRQLRRLGVLWSVDGGVEPGIPSLMDSLVEHGGQAVRQACSEGLAWGRKWARLDAQWAAGEEANADDAG